jgi:hypothetical protein
MTRYSFLLAMAVAIGAASAPAWAGHQHAYQRGHMNRGAAWYAANQSWHGNHNHVMWGRPLAVIVPPTASFQSNYSWGVGRTTMTPIYHQYGRPVAVPTGQAGLAEAPHWPSNTNQQGAYYIRGPW